MKKNVQILDNLTKWISGTPKVFLNIGVGPSKKLRLPSGRSLMTNREAVRVASTWPGIRIIGFEPNIDLFVERLVDYPGELYPWGLWCESCFKMMTITPNDGNSSILPFEDKNHTYQQSPIACTTLDCIDREMQLSDDIFIWMDIEGAELEALKGGSQLLSSGRVKWIAVEVEHKSRRTGAPSEDDISDYLSTYGFVPKRHYEYSKYTHNVLYVKKDGPDELKEGI